MEQVPGFEYGTIYAPAWGKTALYTDPKNPQYFYETPWAVSPGFAKVVGLKFIAGSDAEMGQPESIIVSESYARKLFPDGNALGAYLYIEGSNFLTPDATKYRICGIYEDLPENCQFKNDLFVTMGERVQKDDWGSQNYFAFFRLKPGVSVEEANRQIAATRAIDRMNVDKDDKTALYVFPIRDFYYTMHSPYYLKTGSRSTTALLVVIGMLIIAIACINLVNFSTALAPMRMRSINTQKVLGSTNGELRRALTLESVCTVLVGWLIALGITATLIHLNVLSFMGFTPSLLTYWQYVAGTGVIALAVGIIAGLYPAWYMTSFPPALVLKGNYALSGKGKRLRTLLIGFQYVVSFALIVSAAFIFLQNRYMRNRALGFDRDQLLVASLPEMPYQSSPYHSFESKLKSYAEIADVAFAKWELGANEGYTSYAFDYKGERYYHFFIEVSTNFPDVMGMKLTSGTGFLPSDSISKDPMIFLATEDLQRKTGIEAGEMVSTHQGLRAKHPVHLVQDQRVALRVLPQRQVHQRPVALRLHPRACRKRHGHRLAPHPPDRRGMLHRLSRRREVLRPSLCPALPAGGGPATDDYPVQPACYRDFISRRVRAGHLRGGTPPQGNRHPQGVWRIDGRDIVDVRQVVPRPVPGEFRDCRPRGVVCRVALDGAVQRARAPQPVGVRRGVRRHLPHHRADDYGAELPCRHG